MHNIQDLSNTLDVGEVNYRTAAKTSSCVSTQVAESLPRKVNKPLGWRLFQLSGGSRRLRWPRTARFLRGCALSRLELFNTVDICVSVCLVQHTLLHKGCSSFV